MTSYDTSEITDLKPYTTKELAMIYGVCTRTFSKWIKPFSMEIGIRQGRYYSVTQSRIIFERLGMPGRISNKEMLSIA